MRLVDLKDPMTQRLSDFLLSLSNGYKRDLQEVFSLLCRCVAILGNYRHLYFGSYFLPLNGLRKFVHSLKLFRMKILLLFSIILLPFLTFSQINIDSISRVDYQLLHDTDLNDVWGYVDESGIEYALVGARKGTSVVSLENPTNPAEVFWEPGMESIWRDLKTWQDYAFITTEAENGLLIIDLSPLPSSTALSTAYYNGPVGFEWSSAHNLFIDSNGYAYIFGANRGNGGVIILDVFTDPMNPIEVGTFDDWYVHDGYVRNDTMFLAHISDGFLSLVDVSDKANPILLGTKTTPDFFTHNIWPSDDGNVVYTTDEVSGAYLASYDITDPLNIIELDKIQSSPGQGIIPHNVHVLGDFIITSYYSDGLTIHDVTHPHNMILVGQYDTYPLQTSSYDGCWGAYPFLPSGLILAADITEGLFILAPDYIQASYLEGIVTDASSTNVLNNVAVQIVGHDQVDNSNSTGIYATGILGEGTYDVMYSKVGYFPQTISVTLAEGSITVQDVQLIPIPPFNLTVNVLEEGTLVPIVGADIILSVPLISHEGVSNGIGQEDFVLFYQEEYFVTVGKWSYVTRCFDQLIDENSGSITVLLPKGYHDEFTFDFGWISTGTATSGLWERGKPFGVVNGPTPSFDADADCGINAFVTGNDAVFGADEDDVDGGYSLLISPTMNLTTYSDPHLNYARWFFCMHGAPPDDSLKVIVSNGFESIMVDQIGPNDITLFNQWIPKSIRLLDYISLTTSMQVQFLISDEDPDVNITEGGIDYFYISNSYVLEIKEAPPGNLSVYPNPFNDNLFIEGATQGSEYEVYSIHGQLILKGILPEEARISMVGIPNGLYLLSINGEVIKVMKD